MTRRNLELVLLCVATPIVVLMFAMLAINQGQRLGLATLGVPLGLAGAFLVAHVATRFLAADADPAILPITFALSGIVPIVSMGHRSKTHNHFLSRIFPVRFCLCT